MNSWTQIWRRMSAAHRSEEIRREIAEELRFHIDLKVEELKHRGVSAREALEQARQSLLRCLLAPFRRGLRPR